METQQPAKKPQTWLLKKEVCKGILLTNPVDLILSVISSVEANATHVQAFPDRKRLWKDVSASAALPDLIGQLVVGYVNLYKSHHKGKDKYSRFLVAWYELFSRFAVEASDPEDVTWCAVVRC